MAKDKAQPAPEEEVWWTGLRWVEAVMMQAERFETVLREFQQAFTDARMRASCAEAGDDRQAWLESYDRYEPYDPRRPIRVPTYALWMQVTTDLDLLMVAIRNVMRAQDRLPHDLVTAMAGQDVLALLRNISEHWDEVGGPSITKLARDHPGVSAERFTSTNKEIWIGRKVPLSRIVAWMARVHEAFVTALQRKGFEFPDPMSSVEHGDDELRWPPERRRYRLWEAPLVEMEDWPTEELPPDVAADVEELLGQRFRNLRERDGVD